MFVRSGAWLSLSLLLVAGGCGEPGNVVITGTVHVSATVAPAAAGSILSIEYECSGVCPTADPLPDRSQYQDLLADYAPGQSDYPYRFEHLGIVPRKTWLGAFVDLNANDTLDPGEPWGEAAAGPIPNAEMRPPAEVDITIDKAR